jgi:hypothetical protein
MEPVSQNVLDLEERADRLTVLASSIGRRLTRRTRPPRPDEGVAWLRRQLDGLQCSTRRSTRRRRRDDTRETWGREDIYLLRPAPSSDGPPFLRSGCRSGSRGTENRTGHRFALFARGL